MVITDVEEAILALKPRLRQYLGLKLGTKTDQKMIRCFAHPDDTPSMSFPPGQNDEVVHCHGCGWTGNIFRACAEIEGMPGDGPGWLSETLPHLGDQLGLQIRLGEPSRESLERARLFKFCGDIEYVLRTSGGVPDYVDKRNWINPDLFVGSIDDARLMQELREMGWDQGFINSSRIVRGLRNSYFGEDKVTFTIKDHRGRVCGFISRQLEDGIKPKYVNSPDSLIFSKSEVMMGLDTALKTAKKQGLIVVEGPGDLAQLRRLGIQNSAAVCGTALTNRHLQMLRLLGIQSVYLCMDWDTAGVISTQKILKNEVAGNKGLGFYVIEPPADSSIVDLDELLREVEDAEAFEQLTSVTGFEWMLKTQPEHLAPDKICEEMIPLIAVEPAAVRREILMRTLAEYTGVSYQSIFSDVFSQLNNKAEERRRRLTAAIEKYNSAASSDPGNIQSIISTHEREVMEIEKDYQSESIGAGYQLSRYKAIQERKQSAEDDTDQTEFKSKIFKDFWKLFQGGLSITDGPLFYVGGRAHSGKTLMVTSIAMDVLYNDPDAGVIIHTIDDSFPQIEPRLKTTLAKLMFPYEYHDFSVGMAANPTRNVASKKHREMYAEVDLFFSGVLADERLIVLDQDDGSTLSALERNVRYFRQKYPNKKLFIVLDNTHNYMDFLNLDAQNRMRCISDAQKTIAGKYHACVMATVEYRKNMPQDTTRMKLPIDDDIADSRALTYRPNVIMHVYNDLQDRGPDSAEIFRTEPGSTEKLPRLLICVTKNKITGVKERVTYDLAVNSLTLEYCDINKARNETMSYNLNEDGTVTLHQPNLEDNVEYFEA